MAKFGLFTVALGDDTPPKVTFEGDYIVLTENTVVGIWKGTETSKHRLVGVVQLALGEYVREIPSGR